MKKKVNIIPTWIFDNLNEHGNCLIPSKIVRTYGLETVEKAIKSEGKIKVKIQANRIKTNGDLMPLDKTFQKNKYAYDYIAWKVEK